MIHLRLRLTLGFALLLGLFASQAFALRYVVRAVDGILVPHAMNGHGDVVGTGKPIYINGLTDGTSRGALNRGGEVIDLGTLEGGKTSDAWDVNDAGTVVGWSSPGNGCSNSTAPAIACHAVVWKAGVIQDLGATVVAERVNEADVIAGDRWYVGADNNTHYRAIVWVDGVPTDLPPLPGDVDAYAAGIDASGRVVGHSDGHATRWVDAVPVDLGTFPTALDIFASATNGAGDVVGWFDVLPYGNDYHAFVFQNGTMRDLRTYRSHARAINAADVVVGDFEVTSGRYHAFVWDEQSGFRDLNTLIDPASGWVFESAADINDSGTILGSGSLGVYSRTFVASPDHDEDGIPDDTDPCTNIGQTSVDRLNLQIARTKLRLRADVTVIPSLPVDPVAHGFRLILSSSTDGAFVDATIPGGTRWQDDGTRARWRAPARQSVGGLTQVRLRRLRTPGQLRIDVVGSGVSSPSTTPIAVTVVIDAPVARTGQCAETTIDGSRCSRIVAGRPLHCSAVAGGSRRATHSAR